MNYPKNRKKRAYAVAYTDQELIDNAKLYTTKTAWKEAGDKLRAEGKSSHYGIARKRHRAFFVLCTAHMNRIPSRLGQTKYPDDEILEKMRLCKTPVEFKRRFASHYNCVLHRPHLKAKMAEILAPAPNPYGSDYAIYAYEFADRHAYVGLTFRWDERHKDHSEKGPVFEHAKVCREFSLKRLEESIPTPAAAKEAETRWHDKYAEAGWVMLNTAPCGGLGAMNRRWTVEACLEEALKWPTRKAWLTGSQVSYKKAKKLGCFEACVAHMPRYDSHRLFGREISEESRRKMSASARGRTNGGRHRARISEGVKRQWAEGRGWKRSETRGQAVRKAKG